MKRLPLLIWHKAPREWNGGLSYFCYLMGRYWIRVWSADYADFRRL